MVEITQNEFQLLIPVAVLLDLLVGDPIWSPHPVVIMGSIITTLRKWIEKVAGNNKHWLRVGGLILTLILVFLSGISGWLIERLTLEGTIFNIHIRQTILAIALSSGLAARSLYEGVMAVLKKVQEGESKVELDPAREMLSRIVGRDVYNLNRDEILRATAETASENAVDGIFAPLFWMFMGLCSWQFSMVLPGPLCFVWVYKAVSTLDSMVGYRRGKLLWLGTTSARLEDIMTWIPCRVVVLTLPIITKPINKYFSIVGQSLGDGSKDISPNSGISEAIFAYCSDVRMGGINCYQNHYIKKPILAKFAPKAEVSSIIRILKIVFLLESFWIFSYLLTLTIVV